VATRELKTVEMLFQKAGLDLRGFMFIAAVSAVMQFTLFNTNNAQTELTQYYRVHPNRLHECICETLL
jgi:hypothetical protein